MPTFVYMDRCDGCGKCVDICPSDIMHIDTLFRRAYNLEPDSCWECYSCVKECPQHAIDVRGYADFAPLGHGVRVLREPERRRISWKIVYRNGKVKEFTFPIRTTDFGSIKPIQEYPAPDPSALSSPLLAREPEMLKTDGLPTLNPVEREKKEGKQPW
jgi:adenylylsulfate reductase subunit B